MQKPTIGRIVHVSWEGCRTPAIITYIWSDTCVNVLAYPDFEPPVALSSATYQEESAESAAKINEIDIPHGYWTWPPRAA